MAPKRKTSKPPSSTKKQKISEAASPSQPPDYSNLPLATLTQIVSYLNKKDDCLKPISETCQKFKVIALDSGRLKLCLDFNRITDERNYPKVSRSYRHIRLIGDESTAHQRCLAESACKAVIVPVSVFERDEASTTDSCKKQIFYLLSML